MAKKFNITGTCYPEKHYMVDISERLSQIESLVEDGEYITINRGRQYGKTTTLYHLAKKLSDNYVVFYLSVEDFTEREYNNCNTFAYAILKEMKKQINSFYLKNATDFLKNGLVDIVKQHSDNKEVEFDDFSDFITDICTKSPKPLILIIDEFDSASDYDSFIDFLRMLRKKFLNKTIHSTFQSVILAGVYDIKNLKLKVRPNTEHQYNSPWNISIPFKSDMSFSVEQTAQMLSDYENDHKTGMNISEIASLINDYTAGYPFLVSKLCLLIDEENLGWNKEGVLKAVKILLNEKNTFFDDLNKKLDDFPQMDFMFKEILYYGNSVPFNIDDKIISIAVMFNYVVNNNGKVKISNRIIETRLYNKFMSGEKITGIYREGDTEKSQFIENGELKMDKILERFAVHFNDIYGGKEQQFREEEGRRFFMLYIRPIINGTGNYYIEAETRDRSRTDMIIDYLGKQYIIEMKIWRGESYNERGEKQLFEYLDYYRINKGYMLSFCFNKNKVTGVNTIKIGGKEIVEAVV
ncbi:MAG: ATP-binding protein [Bacteroidales bacterium]|nr:ATP-binding protein [Bacteroidales bacterium]